MELTGIETYIINELENSKKRIKELEQEKKELEETFKNVSLNKVKGAPALGVVYNYESYTYKIDKETLPEFKRALKEKDFEWLKKQGWKATSTEYNYILHLGDRPITLSIYYNDGDPAVYQIKGCFNSEEEAKEALLKKLKATITSKEEMYKDE